MDIAIISLVIGALCGATFVLIYKVTNLEKRVSGLEFKINNKK